MHNVRITNEIRLCKDMNKLQYLRACVCVCVCVRARATKKNSKEMFTSTNCGTDYICIRFIEINTVSYINRIWQLLNREMYFLSFNIILSTERSTEIKDAFLSLI